MRTSGVLICVPAYGQNVTAHTMQAIYSTGQWLTANKIANQLVWFSGADIVEVRNLFLTIWYDAKPEYSHMLFVDADMGFPPELVRDMLRFDKPLLGTIYAKRKTPASLVGTLYEGHSSKDMVRGFLPAQDMGCGVMMITRAMVEHMLEKMPELNDALPSVLAQASDNFGIKRLIRAFDPIREGPRRLSEDVSFCHRWKQCGGEIWANVAHSISHVGPFDFAVRYGGILENAEKTVEAA